MSRKLKLLNIKKKTTTQVRTTLLLKPALRHRKFQKAQRRKIKIKRTKQMLFLPVFQDLKASKRRATVIATRMFSLFQFHLP